MKGKGQALLELALVTPLFIAFFWAACQFAFLFHCRLQLISLKREFALARGRLVQAPGQDRTLADALAVRLGLEPGFLSLEITPGSPRGLAMPAGTLFPTSLFAYDHITLGYLYHFSGAAAALFPKGLKLKEDLVCRSGPWKKSLS